MGFSSYTVLTSRTIQKLSSKMYKATLILVTTALTLMILAEQSQAANVGVRDDEPMWRPAPEEGDSCKRDKCASGLKCCRNIMGNPRCYECCAWGSYDCPARKECRGNRCYNIEH